MSRCKASREHSDAEHVSLYKAAGGRRQEPGHRWEEGSQARTREGRQLSRDYRRKGGREE